MKENWLKKISGIDNLKSISLMRLIIGLGIIGFGILVYCSFNDINFWVKIGIAFTIGSLGLMFILDGQSILREHFRNSQGGELKTREPLSFLITFLLLFFIIGSVLFFVKFYTMETPSLYPIVIFLIFILGIIFFHKKISHFEISKNKVLIKMKEDKEKDYENLQLKKKDWSFEIKEVNKNV